MTPHPLLDYETADARKQLAGILGDHPLVIRIRLLRRQVAVDGYPVKS
ncbi:MAG TPA: hypothetical protein VNF73_06265 [Candidatus Saccharimonadales bacterium]|nr:hypothetical protein [Candidatus Saccharimonadales bacterium]